MRGERTPSDCVARGQTLPDFAVGVAVFLIAVAFVTVFVPQLALPFDGQDESVVAERITADLGNDLLTEREPSSKLNESSTTAFFDGGEDAALERLGIEPRYSVNVTLRDAPSHNSNSEILCAVEDPDADEWLGDECAPDADRFAIGRPLPHGDRSVATGRRALFAGDTDAVLEVRVW